jgi:fatty-acyl-CoA synthase
LDGNLPLRIESTPTASKIALRCADFSTLTEALDYAADGQTGFNYYNGRGELTATLPYRVLRDKARALARRLQGLGRGSRIALVAHTHPDFAIMFFACQYAALVPVPLPAAIHIGGREAYVHHLRRMMLDCRAAAAFAPGEFVDLLSEAATGLLIGLSGTMDEFMAMEDLGPLPAPPRPEELAYLQYTSGSTRFPRGTMITQAAVLHNLEAIFNHGFPLTRDDRFCSWLPYYHDMGLVGIFLGCVATQRSVDFLGSRDFAMRPWLWLKLMSQNRSTISFSPPFGYVLGARRLRANDIAALDLSVWRIAGIGAEMIHPEVLNAFADALAPAGFKPSAFLPCYGMAECALAVSFAPVGSGLQIDFVDGEHLSRSGESLPFVDGVLARRKGFINCGVPLPGFEIEVRDENGHMLADRRVGRIHLRSRSVMSGYFDNPQATRDVLSADGWLDTGDLGYFVDDSLYITGRAKDLLIVNGRNIWPQDLENLAELQDEVRHTDASAFSVPAGDGSEIAVLVVQCREPDPTVLASLVERLYDAIAAEFGIRCLIELVPPHTMPRTSSGKLSRSTARKEFLERHSGERLSEIPPRRFLIGDGSTRRAAARSMAPEDG